mgnify:CR=1 FL=1
MRNPRRLLNVVTAKVRFDRSRPGRYKLTRILGRGHVVTQRTAARTPRQAPAGTGVVILAIGIGLILADFSLVGIGRSLALGGLIFACYQRLDRRIGERTAAADEIYQLGYDVGHERGHEEGYAEGRTAARPVVVDLAARRDTHFEAVDSLAFSPAVIVGDRD